MQKTKNIKIPKRYQPYFLVGIYYKDTFQLRWDGGQAIFHYTEWSKVWSAYKNRVVIGKGSRRHKAVILKPSEFFIDMTDKAQQAINGRNGNAKNN